LGILIIPAAVFFIVIFLAFTLLFNVSHAPFNNYSISRILFLPTTTLDSIFCHFYVALFCAGYFLQNFQPLLCHDTYCTLQNDWKSTPLASSKCVLMRWRAEHAIQLVERLKSSADKIPPSLVRLALPKGARIFLFSENQLVIRCL
jgi:hypothetical protein